MDLSNLEAQCSRVKLGLLTREVREEIELQLELDVAESVYQYQYIQHTLLLLLLLHLIRHCSVQGS